MHNKYDCMSKYILIFAYGTKKSLLQNLDLDLQYSRIKLVFARALTNLIIRITFRAFSSRKQYVVSFYIRSSWGKGLITVGTTDGWDDDNTNEYSNGMDEGWVIDCDKGENTRSNIGYLLG